MSNGAAGGATAAIVAAKRKRIYKAFRNGGATTASNARALSELGVSESFMFNMLVRRGEIVKAEGDRYYLNEEAVQAGRRRRMMIVVAMFLIILVAWYIMRVLQTPS